MKKLIILCTIIVVAILYLENKKQVVTPPPVNQTQEDTRKITEVLLPNSKLITKKTTVIQGGNFCSWIIEKDFAYGIYAKKSFFPKVILENSELTVEWVTDKKVMLPGLVNTVPEQDTTILAKTSNDQEIYIVIVSGEGLKTIKKRNKTYYYGEAKLALMRDLVEAFKIK
jgi:hypothetical protein